MIERFVENLLNAGIGMREKLAGKVHYGVFEHDVSIAVRVNADGSETYGRFAEETPDFVPFTEEEDAALKAKFRWHFTGIFQRNNVVEFSGKKPPTE